MGFLEDQEAYQKGYGGGGFVSATEPGYGQFVRGQTDRYWENRRLADAEYGGYQRPVTTSGSGAGGYQGRVTTSGSGAGGYSQTLIGAPITVGLIGGVVALVAGGDFVEWALVSGGATFALILAIGLLRVARALAPLAIVVALVLWLLDLVDVGPGLPPW